MINDRSILALIPARAGSKRLPGKNIKLLAGKPLIAWSIEEAKKSKYIDRIVVSTDDQKIAEISRKHGAEIPFLRPEHLARDESKGIDVVLHVIEWMEKTNQPYDLIMLLQPTTPLRKLEDIEQAIKLLFSKNAQAIISVCQAQHHPYWANTLPKDGCMKDFIKNDVRDKNRQSLSKFYRLNGVIYLAYCNYIKAGKSFFGNKTYAYVMPAEKSVDIDTELDFKFAEFLLKRY